MCELCQQGIDKSRLFGKYYGYPDCCIDQWINDSPYANGKPGNKITELQEEVYQMGSKDYGFYPCDKCCLKIIRGQITIDQLIINRICPDKFRA